MDIPTVDAADVSDALASVDEKLMQMSYGCHLYFRHNLSVVIKYNGDLLFPIAFRLMKLQYGRPSKKFAVHTITSVACITYQYRFCWIGHETIRICQTTSNFCCCCTSTWELWSISKMHWPTSCFCYDNTWGRRYCRNCWQITCFMRIL